MRILIITLLGLALAAPSYSSIFNSVTQYNPNQTFTCMSANNPSITAREEILDYATQQAENYANTLNHPIFFVSATITSDYEVDNGNGTCSHHIQIETIRGYDQADPNPDVVPFGSPEYDGGSRNGNYVGQPVCPSPDNINATYLHSNNFCYRPEDLQNADTCDTGDTIPKINSILFRACVTLENGSRCQVQTNFDGSFIVDSENGCYGNQHYQDYTLPEPSIPAINSCKQADDGYIYCNDFEPIDNGFSNTKYCGTYDIGTGENYVCFDRDTDSDGLPDYNDEDIDNDGTPNVSDTDADGDGTPNQDDTDTFDIGSGDDTGTGSGDIEVNVALDDSGIISAINQITNTSGYVEDTSTYTNQIDQETQDVDNEFQQLVDKTDADIGLDPILSEDIDIITPIFNVTGNCENPVILDMTIDLCSKETMFNTWLNWILGAMTLIFVYREITGAFGGAK